MYVRTYIPTYVVNFPLSLTPRTRSLRKEIEFELSYSRDWQTFSVKGKIEIAYALWAK